MRKKKEEEVKKGAPAFMATYGDMVTLLMTFFVLLFAMAPKIDPDLFERIMSSFPSHVPSSLEVDFTGAGDVFASEGGGIMPNIDEPPPASAQGDADGTGENDRTSGSGGHKLEGDAVGDMMNTFRTYMAEALNPIDGTANTGTGNYQLEEGENFVRITFDEIGNAGVFFDSAQAILTQTAKDALDLIGPVLKDFTASGHGIIIEGHTDNRPIRSNIYPSNWTLSSARASAVVEYLVDNFNIDVRMIAGLGRGEHFPVNTANAPDAWAQNRRVEIKIFTQEATASASAVIGGWFQIPGT